MKLNKKFSFDNIDQEFNEASKYYNDYGFVIIEDVFSTHNCNEIKNRAIELVLNDNSDKTVGFSLRKNKHHSDANFLSSAYKINYFYEDKMVREDGSFKDIKINCISKLGHCLHDIDKVFKKYSYHDNLKKLFQILKINNPILGQSSYIFKQPYIGGEYLWHQDSTYLLTEPLSCLAFSIAIDDANKENGCLIVKPSSHKENVRKRVKLVDSKIIREDLIKLEWDEEDNYALEVKRGAVIIFHGSLAHKSLENTSNFSRNSYVIHFFDKKANYSKENWLQRPHSLPFKDYL